MGGGLQARASNSFALARPSQSRNAAPLQNDRSQALRQMLMKSLVELSVAGGMIVYCAERNRLQVTLISSYAIAGA